jgi:hypothetical protein
MVNPCVAGTEHQGIFPNFYPWIRDAVEEAEAIVVVAIRNTARGRLPSGRAHRADVSGKSHPLDIVTAMRNAMPREANTVISA